METTELIIFRDVAFSSIKEAFQKHFQGEYSSTKLLVSVLDIISNAYPVKDTPPSLLCKESTFLIQELSYYIQRIEKEFN